MNLNRVNGTSSLRTYKGSVAANATLVFDVVGNYVRLATTKAIAAQDAPMRLRTDTGMQADVYPGQGLRGDFSKVYVDDLTGFAQTFALQIGDGQVVDNTISGAVQIVDGGKLRTIANLSFGAAGGRTPVAGQKAAVGFTCGSAATRRAVVERIIVSNTSAVANVVGLQSTVTQLSGWTLVMGGRSKYPRLIGNATSSAWVSVNDFAMPASLEAAFGIAAGQTIVLQPGQSPWVIDPGMGLVIASNVADSALWASFEWFEESMT